jgi:hypothetical protein
MASKRAFDLKGYQNIYVLWTEALATVSINRIRLFRPGISSILSEYVITVFQDRHSGMDSHKASIGYPFKAGQTGVGRNKTTQA